MFYESLIQNEGFNHQLNSSQANGWIFVPIPLFKNKLKKRGYNQAEILAKELNKKLGIFSQNILTRVRDDNTKLGLGKDKKNVKDAFVLDLRFNPSLKNIFLVDDVVATGSTLLEAAKILKKSGTKKVIGLTLARN